MQESDRSAKAIARWVALGALFLIPLVPLIVSSSFFFPFITSKAFYFRILVEILVAAWVVLALLDKEYRPRISWIGAVLLAFVAWMFVADSFAINVAKAFWSNFERMEGWVLLIHLLGFFIAAGAVLRVEKKWRAWFLTGLSVSLVVSGYALLQLGGALAIHQGSTRIDATLGNSAYLAIYLLFNVFIALWLALTPRKDSGQAERAWLKWSLIALAALEGVLIFFTETRGAVLGFLAGLALTAVLAAVTGGARVRRYALAGLALLMLFSGGVYLARDSSFVRDNHVLQRITSVSLSDGQTRFTIWRMAFSGVRERPLTGWGQEGFNYVFNKYYDPSLYAQEQWFDRAHNAFIDWLSAGGAPAFLLYVGLFASGVALLWRRSEISRPERILLTSAFLGYAIHNVFVFDNLVSYIYFIALLAFIDSRVSRPISQCESIPEVSAEAGLTYALPVAGVVAFALVWSVNVPGMRVASELIQALTPSPSGLDANIAAFKDLAAHPAFAAQEVREQIVSFATSVAGSSGATNAQKQEAVSLAMNEMRKQVAAYPLDARERLQLSYAYRAAGDGADALQEIRNAIAFSPKKEMFRIEAGAIEWELGDMKAAQADFDAAYALAPQFSDLAVYAAAGDIAVGDQGAADAILRQAFGITAVDNDVLAVAYYRAKNWPRLVAFWKARAAKPSATAQDWFSLASAQYVSGDASGAIATLRAAAALHPEVASAAEAAIAQIRKTPSGK